MNNKIEMYKMHLIGEERSKNTIDKYVKDIKKFFDWYGSDEVVSKEVLLEYKKYLLKSNYKITTINSKISSLNSYFTFIENESLKMKYIKCQKSLFGCKDKELTINEYKRLYDACRGDVRLKLILETISKTGIRVSELKYITYDAVNNGKSEIYNKGKIRTILLPRKLCIKLLDYYKRELKTYMCEPKTFKVKDGNNSGERDNRSGERDDRRGERLRSPHFLSEALTNSIFLTRNGTPLSRKHIWQMMKNLAIKANVDPQKVFPHNLRHLFAREFYKQTKDIVKLSCILGHSSIETTRIYTKDTEDECRNVLDRIMILKN